MPKCFGPLICVLLLSACAYVDNSHPRNAIPLEPGELRSSFGYASSNNINYLGNYKPDDQNEIIHSRTSASYGTHTPTRWDLGIGYGYTLGVQGGIFFGPSFKGQDFDQQYGNIGIYYHLKMNAQKSFKLGSNTYLAMFPGIGIGQGTETIVRGFGLRYNRISPELPITLSKLYGLSANIDLIVSLSTRAAVDWVESDIMGGGGDVWSYIYYLDQPLNRIQRNALMGHIDLQFREMNWNITLQYGAEHSTGDRSSRWSPVFYIGMGPYVNFKR